MSSKTPLFTIEGEDGGMLTLVVAHKCGHVERLAYFKRQAVDADAPRQTEKLCTTCYCKAEVEKSKKKKSNG